MSRRLATIYRTADIYGVSHHTIRRHIKLGRFPVYRVPGQRAAVVDLDEVAAYMATRSAYGPAADVRTLTAEDLKDAEVTR